MSQHYFNLIKQKVKSLPVPLKTYQEEPSLYHELLKILEKLFVINHGSSKLCHSTSKHQEAQI